MFEIIAELHSLNCHPVNSLTLTYDSSNHRKKGDSMAINNNNAEKKFTRIESFSNAELFDISTHLELEALALAWAIRNRQFYLHRVQNRNPGNGDPTAPFGLPDPTRGATHFHRHDETPPWAATREPIALIGCYLFYDLRCAADLHHGGLVFAGDNPE